MSAADLRRRSRRPSDPARVLFSSVALLGVVVAAVMVTGVVSIGQLNESSRRNFVRDALPATSHAHDLMLSLVNEETGVRGYIVTGNPQNLRPYHEGRRNAPKDLAALAGFAQRDPPLQPLLGRARGEIREIERYFAAEIALAQEGYLGQLRAQVEVDRGQVLFDRFRATAAAIDRETAAFVKRAEHRQNTTYRLFTVILIVVGSAGLLLSGLLLLLGPRRVRRLYADLERGARASLALNRIREGVVLTDDEGSVLYANRAARSAWESPGDDPTAGAASLEDVLRAAEQSLTEPGAEVTIPVATDSGERWISIAAVRSEGGTVYRLRDETEEHELERVRSDFVATASHELRTPIAAVYGAAETLRRTDIELDDATRDQLLAVISSESASLAAIVEQILFAGALDRGSVDLVEDTVVVAKLAESVAASAASKAPANVSISIDAEDPDLALVSDEPRLRQVLANLVENAVKYSPDGGAVEVRLSEGDGCVVVEVEDAGIGIASSDRDRIFEKFYRVDAAMSGGVGGTGLGLYIVRELVTRLGGTVSVASEVGRGSTFRVVLPLRAGQPLLPH